VFLGVMVLFAAGVIRTRTQLRRVWKVDPAPVPVPGDALSIAEGQRLFLARGCGECHGEDAGGKLAVSDRALGQFQASNLTRGVGGVGEKYSVVDWVRSIREGVKPDGHGILLMPSEDLNLMSDREVGEVVAFLQTAAPVDRVMPPSHLGPVVYMAYGLAHQFPLISAEKINHSAPRPPDIVPSVTPAFGGHLADMQCRGCHGATLSGGRLPGAPPSLPVPRNITPDPTTGLGRWSQDQFVTAMRTGKRPDGSAIDPFMPWKTFSHLTDDELTSMWLYLRTVPPKTFGQR